jgi:class 3 adenylate cyclase/tetratricopeptide (TPR) repeat protein
LGSSSAFSPSAPVGIEQPVLPVPTAGSGPLEHPAAQEEIPPGTSLQIFLFVDVRGYTRFTIEHGDEQAAQLAVRFAGLARQVVTAHDGRVLELRGDEALAVFTSARRALRAAVALQTMFQQATVEDGSLPLPVGIGLDAGEAVPVEGGYRGAALNLASRLCALAAAGEALASDTVLGLAGHVEGLVYEARDPVLLKGFAEPVRYACLSTVSAGTVSLPTTSPDTQHAQDGAGTRTDQRALLPVGSFLGALPEGPLVARQVELERICEELDTVSAGVGRLLLLTGEPGVGKTRLAQEAMVAAQARGFLVATGRCYAPQAVVAYYPFVEALHHVLGQAPGELRGTITERWPEVMRLLPEAMPGVHGGRPLPDMGTPKGQGDDQQRLFWQVTGFVQALAGTRSLTLLLDDLHWADGASLDLLAHLARHTRGDRILLLGVYRDVEVTRQHPLEDVMRDLGRERLLDRIPVHRLPIEGTRALIGAALGMNEVSEAFAGLLHERAEGNPFFTGELLRDLIEQGAVYKGSEGRWQRHDIEEITIPEGVRAVIGQRIGRLASSTQETLTEAAILGQVFAFDELVGMAGRTEEEVEEALEEATGAGLIREERQNRAGGAYTFVHVLIQQTLYTEITARRRRRLHRAAGEVIERLPERARDLRAAELAWHFREADEPGRALPYAVLAGDQAEAVFAHHEAETHFLGALDLARQLDDHIRHGEALEKLAGVQEITGRHDDARASYEQVLALHRAALLPDKGSVWLAHLHYRIAVTFNSQQRFDRAGEACAQAEATLGDASSPVSAPEWWQTWLEIQLLRLTLHYLQGQLPEMIALTEEVQPVLERYGAPGQRVEVFGLVGITNVRRERYVISDETLGYAQAALRAALEAGNLRDIADTQFAQGFCRLWYGDLDVAEEALSASLALADRVGTGRYGDLATLCLTYLTLVQRKRGQPDEAERYAEQAFVAATARELPSYVGTAHANLGWVAWRRGDLVAAAAQCQAALEGWSKSQMAYMFQWTALWPLISMACAEDRLADAVTHARVLLSPLQQRPPLALNALLDAVVQAWDDQQPEATRRCLDEALALAMTTGYL